VLSGEMGDGRWEWEVWSVQLIKVYEGLYRFIVVTSNSTFVVRCSSFVVALIFKPYKSYKLI
jgi:hypothetical protein